MSLREALLDGIDSALAGGGASVLTSAVRLLMDALQPHTTAPYCTAVSTLSAEDVVALLCEVAPLPYCTESLITAEHLVVLVSAIACTALNGVQQSISRLPQHSKNSVVIVGKMWTKTSECSVVHRRSPMDRLKSKTAPHHVVALPTPLTREALGNGGGQRAGGCVSHSSDVAYPLVTVACDALLLSASQSLAGVVQSFAMLELLVLLYRREGAAGYALWTTPMCPPLRNLARFPELCKFAACRAPSWLLLLALCAESCPGSPEVLQCITGLLHAKPSFCALSTALSSMQFSAADPWRLQCLGVGSSEKSIASLVSTNSILACLCGVIFQQDGQEETLENSVRKALPQFDLETRETEPIETGYCDNLLSVAHELVSIIVRLCGAGGGLILTQEEAIFQSFCVRLAFVARGCEVKIAELSALSIAALGTIVEGVVEAFVLRLIITQDSKEASTLLASLAVLCTDAPTYCYVIQELLQPPDSAVYVKESVAQCALNLERHYVDARELMRSDATQLAHTLLHALTEASPAHVSYIKKQCAAALYDEASQVKENSEEGEEEVEKVERQVGKEKERSATPDKKMRRSFSTLSEAFSLPSCMPAEG